MAEQPLTIKLVGIAGYVEGEAYPIDVGQSVVIGRSRSCDISLRQCPRYLAVDPEQAHADQHFRTVSRRHVTVQFIAPDEVVIRDTSQNGTFLDGRRIAQACVLKNLREKFHELKLGTNETFRLQWGDKVVPKKARLVEVDAGEPVAVGPAADDAAEDAFEARLQALDDLPDLAPEDGDDDDAPADAPDEPPVPDLDFLDDDAIEVPEEGFAFSDEEELDPTADAGASTPLPDEADAAAGPLAEPPPRADRPRQPANASADAPARRRPGTKKTAAKPPTPAAKKKGTKKKTGGMIGKRLRRK